MIQSKITFYFTIVHEIYIEKEKINNVDKIKKAWLIVRTYSILKYIKIIF